MVLIIVFVTRGVTFDRVFCFCCKLLNSENYKSSLGHDGFRDWKHTNDRLKEHEASM
jgi:hypothetical protein